MEESKDAGEQPSSALNESQLDLQEKLEASKQLADRYEKLVQEERTYRQELEKVFEKKAKEAETSTFHLNDQIQSLERLLDNLTLRFGNEFKGLESKLEDVLDINQTLRDNYDYLSLRYQKLMGVLKKTARQMREDQISLPRTVDELQFECLKLREELIDIQAAKEHLEEENAGAVAALNSELEQATRVQGQGLINQTEENDQLKHTIADLEQRLNESQAESNAMAKSLDEYRIRCSQLQVELDNSEAVQKDFVRLSQSLQIQLEKIRSTEQEVRWQFFEDVAKCNGCEADFRRNPKLHCMHCGKVFCSSCTNNEIATGPNNRIAKVCSVCHTLLNRILGDTESD